MVIITEKVLLHCRVRIDRGQAEEVRVASLDEKHSTFPRKRLGTECGEEIAKPMKLRAHL